MATAVDILHAELVKVREQRDALRQAAFTAIARGTLTSEGFLVPTGLIHELRKATDRALPDAKDV